MEFKTWSRTPFLRFQKDFLGDNKGKLTRVFLVGLFSLCIAAANGAPPTTPPNASGPPANVPPLKPYPRLLPLKLTFPPNAQAGVSFRGVNIILRNPGDPAPNSRLRLIIHTKDYTPSGISQELSPDNVKIEVLERGSWIPVVLGMVEGNVMGAIGPEGVNPHSELYKRGGFEIPAGLNKTWHLRVTFSLPGTYTFVAAVSPDNGSRHVAQPVFSDIVVE